ncbi:hypothetical protein HNP84_001508 [Thermocatellispora tengchongensis]|uniref:Uncharacterized protein n=1 Tax=Thermocatellispora tengchongensis TaxID=1073253 RepID=A0A840P6Z3_9ACTN|nr:hypothetical protein [Thermocatellispora tengchongensis]MBB5131795.1 hypothetical protein [Thermocatellispora tengchongensis]
MAKTRKTRNQTNRPKGAATSPPTTTSPPAKPPQRQSPWAATKMVLRLLFAAAAIIFLAATAVTVAIPEVDVALGRTGTPGTATVQSCDRVRKGVYDCQAYFEFADRSKQPILIDTVPDVEVGETFPAALTPEGDRVLPTGARGVWRAILPINSIPFAIALIAFLTALVTRSKKAIAWTGVLGFPFLLAMILGFAYGT